MKRLIPYAYIAQIDLFRSNSLVQSVLFSFPVTTVDRTCTVTHFAIAPPFRHRTMRTSTSEFFVFRIPLVVIAPSAITGRVRGGIQVGIFMISRWVSGGGLSVVTLSYGCISAKQRQ